MIKRIIGSVLIGSLFLLAVTPLAEAKQSWRHDECRYRNYTGGSGWSRQDIEATVRCIVDHFPVSGGVSKVLDVIECESGFGPEAVSPTGEYRGLMQLGDGEFRNNLGPDSWDLHDNVFNPRSNIAAGVRYARAEGWDRWSCG